MKNPLDWLFDLAFSPWEKRSVRAWATDAAVRHAARIVACVAPPDAVAAYVDTAARIDRDYELWRNVLNGIGATVPGFMLAAAWLLDLRSSWAVVGAQLAWLFLWCGWGNLYLRMSLDISRAEQMVNASLDLARASNATQEQLNAAAQAIGLPEWITGNDDTTKPGA